MAGYEVNLDAYVLPSGHRIFKLFPGRTYRLNKQLVESRTAFLDIGGLEGLSDNPFDWSDDELRELISADRILQNSKASETTKRPASQDTKRLTFLKNLLLRARKGDLVVVPLGKGLDGKVAIGEFATEPGKIERVEVQDGEYRYTTWGRSINWRTTDDVRRRFSNTLNKSLHAPTAFHVLEASVKEEVYLAAYGSFTYEDIYVATFPSQKTKLSTSDQASIGVWFNGVAIVHERSIAGGHIEADEDFYTLGLDEGGVDLELTRNSPWSVVVRTVGPLAFSTLALYPMAAEGVPLNAVQHMTVTAKAVAGAEDHCNVVVPPDLAAIAKGLGQGRWDATCRLGKRLKAQTTLRSGTHLNPDHKRPK